MLLTVVQKTSENLFEYEQTKAVDALLKSENLCRKHLSPVVSDCCSLALAMNEMFLSAKQPARVE